MKPTPSHLTFWWRNPHSLLPARRLRRTPAATTIRPARAAGTCSSLRPFPRRSPRPLFRRRRRRSRAACSAPPARSLTGSSRRWTPSRGATAALRTQGPSAQSARREIVASSVGSSCRSTADGRVSDDARPRCCCPFLPPLRFVARAQPGYAYQGHFCEKCDKTVAWSDIPPERQTAVFVVVFFVLGSIILVVFLVPVRAFAAAPLHCSLPVIAMLLPLSLPIPCSVKGAEVVT